MIGTYCWFLEAVEIFWSLYYRYKHKVMNNQIPLFLIEDGSRTATREEQVSLSSRRHNSVISLISFDCICVI